MATDDEGSITEQFTDLGEVAQAISDTGARVHRDGVEVIDMNPSETTATVTFTIDHAIPDE